MPFSNEITGGQGALVRPSIHSPNYVPGVSGWTINKNGTAEFSSVTVRGSVIIFGTQGVFIYNPTPAIGNLVASLAGQAGVDIYGNSYPEGLQIGQSGAARILLGILSGNAILTFPNLALETTAGAIQPYSIGSGTAQQSALVMKSAEATGEIDYGAVNVISSSTDGTQNANVAIDYVDTSAVSHVYAKISAAALNAIGQITAVTPGTGTRATPATAEIWHNAAPAAGWTATGAALPARYRKEGVGPSGGVRLSGELLTTAAVAANSTVFTLPTGYMPIQGMPFITRSDIDVTAGMETVNVLTSGGVQNGQAFTAAGQRLFFDGIVFPLD